MITLNFADGTYNFNIVSATRSCLVLQCTENKKNYAVRNRTLNKLLNGNVTGVTCASTGDKLDDFFKNNWNVQYFICTLKF